MNLPLPIFCLLLAFSVRAIAENRSASLSLSEALSRTLRGSPELAAYDYDTRAAEARLLQASLRPNPELSLDVENPTGSGVYANGEQMEDTLMLSQLIELGGKRSARMAEAAAGRAVVQWEYQVKRVEVLKATTLAFIEAVAAQQRLGLAEEIAKVAEETVTLTDQRVSVGKVSAVDAIRAQVAVSSARIEVEQAKREIATARGHLAARWGARTADFGTVRGDLAQHPSVPALEELRARLLANPELARWTSEREKRAATLAKEQTRARPDLTLRAGPRMEGRAEDATFVAGFSIPLPISNRNQGVIAEARANLSKLDSEKRAAEARAFAALNEAYQQLSGAAEEIALLDKSVIPGAREAETQIVAGYDIGRFTQFEVLEARRTLNAARLQQVRALTTYQKARAELDALTARPTDLPRSSSIAVPAKSAAARRK